MLDIYAGQEALKAIKSEGFKQDLFTSFLGASGGPKWFCLFELDKYLFGDFFKDREQELNLIGSSAGAFRSACFAQKDPVAAISRLAESYSETTYSDKPTPAEITLKARELLDYVLGDDGIDEIIENPVFKAHFLANKTNGFVSSENKLIQMLGLLRSVGANWLNRKLIRNQYERFVFKSPSSSLNINDYCNFKTQYIDLSPANLKEALLASGSIPMVMQGIKDISGAPKGMYRDGGIIDYHFDFQLGESGGLILYPHFNSTPKAGWFDKNLKRNVKPENYDNVVMLVPSPRFVASLPFSKIPDRNDFTKMDASQRIKYWKVVLSETERLSESFNQFLVCQNFENIQKI
ncbi:patatin-like phospholipase family protein [Psychrosphaera aestuarii]|uniref:patatin-like phospholipase family protein n=1 Tax=Psychrosphaera aestuarii TaxID=1266052 RepID=UPI001B31E242|nr:patatin-like phospholipase family protein [Psychrosphaera aestuarii]